MRTLLFLTAMIAVSAGSAVAQHGPPACDGDFAVVRVSEIKPVGSMQGFMAAVAAQKAWHRSHGIADNEIFAARVVDDQNPSAYSEKVVITYHINPPEGAPTGDQAWNDFVKQYRDNSEIKTTYTTWMPKLSRK